MAILGCQAWHYVLAQAMDHGPIVMAKVLYATADFTPVQQKRLPDAQNVHIFRTL